MHSIETSIQKIRKQLLVGQKKGNRFLSGQSRLAVHLQYPSMDWLWNDLVVRERELQIFKPPESESHLDDVVVEEYIDPTESERNEAKTEDEGRTAAAKTDQTEKINEAGGLDPDSEPPKEPFVETEQPIVEIQKLKKLISSSVHNDAVKSFKKLARKATEGLEERGFNFLTLCVGSVSWSDEKHSGVAPILLIPIQLTVTARRSRVTIEYTDEPIQWNPALMEKMRQGLEDESLSLPQDFHESLSDAEEVGLAAVKSGFTILRELCEKMGWAVQDVLWMDLLDASHLQLYRDLELSQWGDLPPLIPKVLGRGFVVDKQLQAMKSAQVENQVQHPERSSLILDADPTQLRAVAIANAGGSLVIQGPPGTGKSQTIANIVSTMIAQGKRILFVAQKKAALDVVYQRLSVANLEHHLLELHSSKSKRSSVLKSINKALQQGCVEPTFATDLIERVEKDRNTLEAVNSLLQRPVGSTTLTMSDIFSHHHQATGSSEIPTFHFEEALSWPPDIVETLKQTSVELSHLIHSERLPWRQNPFRMVALSDVQALKTNNIVDLGQQVRFQLGILMENLAEQTAEIGCSFDGTFKGIDRLVEDLQFLESQPVLTGVNVALLKQEGRWDEALDLVSQGQSLGEAQTRLLTIFEPASMIQYARIEEQLNVVQRLRGRWWKVLFPSWWSTLRTMKLYFRQELQGDVTHWDAPVAELQRFHHRLMDFELKDALGGRIFGSSWKGLSSQWSDLHDKLDWVKNYPRWAKKHAAVQQTQFVDTPNVESRCRHHSTNIQQSFDALQDSMNTLSKSLDALPNCPLSMYSSDVSIEEVYTWLHDPNWTQQSLARAVAINTVSHFLRDRGLDPWVLWIMEGQKISMVENNWEASLGHSRVQSLLSDPTLQRLTRSTLRQQRQNFVRADEQLRYAAQEDLVTDHVASLQSLLCVGQMAILSAELPKRRGQKTIRRLMSECPLAIQRIKPVFMMSPTSVATHLPQHVEFDVVIFDEASQMTTPFALGALMRAHQAIVVGDSQQLSPTSFFQSGSDLESILDRFVVNGCPSIRLSFHYRSRHPDLITISNRYMYEGALKPFPTPNTHPLAKGVRLLSSKGCSYDRGGTRSNVEEAKLLMGEVARVIVQSIHEQHHPSMGVVAFSLAQKEALEDAWDVLLSTRSDIQQYCDALPNGETLFIKNLEDVQGDERDIIFISIGYGYDAKGVFGQNFGPVGKEGGTRRLNVLFSRARFEMVLCANFEPHRIQPTRDSFKMLRSMLELSTSKPIVSVGEPQGFVEDICHFVETCGYKALAHYGPHGNAIDIAVQDPESNRFLLAILCEGGIQKAGGSTRHRDRLFPHSLQRFGWPVYRVWSLPWYTNPDAEKSALKVVIERTSLPKISESSFVLTRRNDTISQSLDWIGTTQWSLEDSAIVVPSGAQAKSHGGLVERIVPCLLTQEGPLSRNMVTTRVCQLLPSKRTKRNRDAIEEVLNKLSHRDRIQTEYGFYWTPQSDLSPRVPGNGFRDFEHLYPPHVLDFVRFYLNGSVDHSVQIHELVEILMTLVGWESLSQTRIQEFTSGIRLLLVGSDMALHEDVVHLN
jgi:hypothetical protein